MTYPFTQSMPPVQVEFAMDVPILARDYNEPTSSFLTQSAHASDVCYFIIRNSSFISNYLEHIPYLAVEFSTELFSSSV